MQLYTGAIEQLEGGVAYSPTGRTFRALLLKPASSQFVTADATITAVLAHAKNVARTAGNYGRVIVEFTSQTRGESTREFRFHMRSNTLFAGFRDGGTGAVVIYEAGASDSASVPVAFLEPADIAALVGGDGAAYEFLDSTSLVNGLISVPRNPNRDIMSSLPTSFELNNAQIIALLAGDPIEKVAGITGKILAPVLLYCKFNQVAPYLNEAMEEVTTIFLELTTAAGVGVSYYAQPSVGSNQFVATGPVEMSLGNFTDTALVVGEPLVLRSSESPVTVTGGHANNKIVGQIFFVPMDVGA